MAVALIAIVWAAFTIYAVLGGADFGAGILHLLARGPDQARQREAIATAIGPVWEANHVWLIFALTGLFSAFPPAFGALGTAAFVPGTLALVAIVVRGAAFAFASQAPVVLFGRLFGLASVAAPFLLGTIAGGLARGGSGPGFWLGPFQLVVGALAVAMCAALAASFLTVEARRLRDRPMAATFRRHALRAAAAVAALAVMALALAPLQAPRLSHRLDGTALPEVLLAFAALAGALAALHRRRYRPARAATAVAVGAVVWGWGLAQYPHIVGPTATVANSAARGPELTAVALAIAGGFVLLVPSLWALYVAFRRQPLEVRR
jgi:cytochrome bd ubiquinol oxidase subunit II